MPDYEQILRRLLFLEQEEAQKILDADLPGYKIIVETNGDADLLDKQGNVVATVRTFSCE